MKDGVGALTLERVARDAGLSKGGLLYHYENKEQLLAGLIEQLLQDWDPAEHDSTSLQSSPPRQSSPLHMDIHETDVVQSMQSNQPLLRGSEIASVLMAARTINPQLLEPIQKRYRNWQNDVGTNGHTPIRPLMARLVTMGLWFSEALGLATPTHEQQERLAQEMRSLTAQKENTSEPSTAFAPNQPPETLIPLKTAPEGLQELEARAHQSLQHSGQSLLSKQDPKDSGRETSPPTPHWNLTTFSYYFGSIHPIQVNGIAAFKAKVDKAIPTILR